MPFLRVIRDKRGYETTYLMDWYREGTRQRTRILYVFRTPGGVRVGRDPLEPDVLRHIESLHPDTAFDWRAVLDTRQVIDAAPDPRRLRSRRRADEGAPESTAEPPERRPPAAGAPAPPTRPPIPSVIEGSTPDEQVVFLSHWHAEVRDRIAQRVSDPFRREALLALAERLNPAAWTDSETIRSGLPQASEALEQLSRVLSRRRRRAGRAPAAPAAEVPVSGVDRSDVVGDAPASSIPSAPQE